MLQAWIQEEKIRGQKQGGETRCRSSTRGKNTVPFKLAAAPQHVTCASLY